MLDGNDRMNVRAQFSGYAKSTVGMSLTTGYNDGSHMTQQLDATDLFESEIERESA